MSSQHGTLSSISTSSRPSQTVSIPSSNINLPSSQNETTSSMGGNAHLSLHSTIALTSRSPNATLSATTTSANLTSHLVPLHNSSSSSANKTHYGSFPSSCYALSFPQTPSIGSMSIASYTDYVPDSATTSASVHTFGGAYTESAYARFDPPRDCCADCEVNADRVRVLYWPVDLDNHTSKAQNLSNAPVVIPYTTVSDGFTL